MIIRCGTLNMWLVWMHNGRDAHFACISRAVFES
jgi:hypothetical protein